MRIIFTGASLSNRRLKRRYHVDRGMYPDALCVNVKWVAVAYALVWHWSGWAVTVTDTRADQCASD